MCLPCYVICVSGTSQNHGKALSWLYTQNGVYVLGIQDFNQIIYEFVFLTIWYCGFEIWYWGLYGFENENFVWKFTVLHVGGVVLPKVLRVACDNPIFSKSIVTLESQIQRN